MIKNIVSNNSSVSISEALDAMVENEQVQSIMMYMGESYEYDHIALSKQLKSISKTVIGSVFPEVIMNGKRFSDSAILLGIQIPMSYVLIDDFEEDKIIEAITEKIENDIDENSTVIILIDALIRNKSTLFDCLYNYYGSVPNYLGGGAGTLKFDSSPCIISNEGVTHGAALISTISKKMNIGVAHGWSPISKQLKVTEANNNEIISLDWKPVMEVYQSIVEEHSKKEFDYDDFYNCVKSYPIGIKKLNDNMTVRDPFKTENGKLFLLDVIEEGSYVQVLFGNLETLINGAADARQKAENENKDYSNTFIIDCISRGLFMGDEFANELNQLDPMSNSFGALTLGEIANDGEEYLDIYNKTAVVGIFE